MIARRAARVAVVAVATLLVHAGGNAAAEPLVDESRPIGWTPPLPTPRRTDSEWVTKWVGRLPAALAEATVIELPDDSVLVAQALPERCEIVLILACAGELPQPSYRYFPKEDRWQPIASLPLAIPNELSPYWTSTADAGIERWAKHFVARANGESVFLVETAERDLLPVSTTLYGWRPGQSAVAKAALRKGRHAATLLELADGRLAVVGGHAQLELVALEKACVDCPDKYVSLGPLRAARTTEVLAEPSAEWLPGPAANYAGGLALRLANGKVFKVAEPAEQGVRAEISDKEFTRWKTLPALPIEPFAAGDFVVAGNRVLILPEAPYDETVVWNDDTATWSAWGRWTRYDWTANNRPRFVIALDARRALVAYNSYFEIALMPD